MPAKKAPDKSLDAVTLLEHDHREVKSLFKEFEKATQLESRLDLAQHIGQKLSVHAQVEELKFYPAIKAIPEVADMVAESLEEHRQVKELIAELKGMQPSDKTFEPKMKVLMEDVEHHVKEEEKEMFPKVRKGLGKEKLSELGHEMNQLMQTAKGGTASGPERITEPVRDPARTGKTNA
jgi:hemerythrin superfamily protein